MQARFLAQIKELSTKNTVDGSRTTRIILEQDNLSTEIKETLNRIQDLYINISKEISVIIGDSCIANKGNRHDMEEGAIRES